MEKKKEREREGKRWNVDGIEETESKPKLSKPARHEGPRSTEESRGAPDRNTHGEDTHGPLISPPSSESTGDTDAPGGEE